MGDIWNILDLRLRHALRGQQDRREGADWIVVPIGDDGSVRVLPMTDPLLDVLDAVEKMAVGEVE